MTTTEIPSVRTKAGRIAKQLQYSMIALILMSGWFAHAQAQNSHQHEMAQDQSKMGDLIKAVRQATERYKDVNVAQADGYALQFGCVSGSDSGAMGLHFINGDIVGSGVIDVTRPQIILYEPTADGRFRLTGADYLVLVDTWNANHSAPPQLMGQLFQFFDSPNRFGLPPFYTLHVWAWKDNPSGAFVNWNPAVSCQNFSGQNP